MSEQPEAPPAAPMPEQQPDPAQGSRGWTARLRGMSGTGKVIFASWAVLIIVVIVVVVVVAAGSAKPKQATPPLAKNFTLPELGQAGHQVSLAAYAGQPVIINFFASWCAPCKRETPLLAAFYKDHHGQVIMIGIDANDQSAAALKFVHAAGVGYPIGFDPTAHATLSYGVEALPQTFFLNAQHRIVKRIYGDVSVKELTEGVTLMDSHDQDGG